MKRLIVLFFLICAIPLSACSKAPEQIPVPTVQRLTSPLELSEDEAATLIQCCGENSVLLAVGHRNTAQTGPLYNTDYLLYWNYSDGSTKQFPVSSPAYIISATLDGADVLYVDYEAMDSGLKWSLIRSTDTGKSTLATGQVSSYVVLPERSAHVSAIRGYRHIRISCGRQCRFQRAEPHRLHHVRCDRLRQWYAIRLFGLCQ